MKLVVRQLKKIIKKVDGLPQTIYQCVLEGADPSGTSIVFGKVTLESDDPGDYDLVLQIRGIAIHGRMR